jgi:5'-nucleotidase/UDP-sugar diphosphatase
MDEAIPLKASTTALVKKWEDAVYNSFRKSGLEPTRDVCRLTDTLKGMEASIRYEQNNLGKIINETLIMDSQADASFINAGAIRIDDNVTGSITELDVIRIMPFGNKIVEVQMKGGLLEQMIKSNDERKGLGGYLQIGKEVGVSNGIVTVNGKSVDKDKVYKIRTIEFLVSGKELRLEMFNEKNPDILTVSQSKDNNGNALDLRLAFIQMLKKAYTNR